MDVICVFPKRTYRLIDITHVDVISNVLWLTLSFGWISSVYWVGLWQAQLLYSSSQNVGGGCLVILIWMYHVWNGFIMHCACTLLQVFCRREWYYFITTNYCRKENEGWNLSRHAFYFWVESCMNLSWTKRPSHSCQSNEREIRTWAHVESNSLFRSTMWTNA